MAKKEKSIEEEIEATSPSRKEELLALYDQLNALGIRSISDLENLIAAAE